MVPYISRQRRLNTAPPIWYAPLTALWEGNHRKSVRILRWKSLIFLLFQLVTERIYKTMTERKFVVLKQKENFILKTEKSFHVQNLEKKLPKREIFAKEKKEKILQKFEWGSLKLSLYRRPPLNRGSLIFECRLVS